MECSEVRLNLDEYIRNRLGEYDSESITVHIRNCPRCSKELNTLQELNDFLYVENPVLAGPEFTSGVMRCIENMYARKFLFNRLSVINLGMSLVLTGLLIIFINIPSVNTAINGYMDKVNYGAAAINSSVGTTTNYIHTYIQKVFEIDS